MYVFFESYYLNTSINVFYNVLHVYYMENDL